MLIYAVRWPIRSILAASVILFLIACAVYPSNARAESRSDRFKMPNLIGMNLQAGQDYLQALDSYSMRQVDATGQMRFLIWDRNWQICRTRPVAGKKVSTSAIITVWAVKYGERCQG